MFASLFLFWFYFFLCLVPQSLRLLLLLLFWWTNTNLCSQGMRWYKKAQLDTLSSNSIGIKCQWWWWRWWWQQRQTVISNRSKLFIVHSDLIRWFHLLNFLILFTFHLFIFICCHISFDWILSFIRKRFFLLLFFALMRSHMSHFYMYIYIYTKWYGVWPFWLADKAGCYGSLVDCYIFVMIF